MGHSTQEAAEALAALESIDPSKLTQDEWLSASMGAEAAGVGYEEWDEWCGRDPERYDEGENRRRWESFDPDKPGGVTAGTLFWMARNAGWGGTGRQRRPDRGARRRGGGNGRGEARPPRLDLPPFSGPDLPSLEEAREVPAEEQLRGYLGALYPREADQERTVVLVTDGRPKPGGGGKQSPWGRGKAFYVGDLIEAPGKALGKGRPEVGAWVTVNPFDAAKFEREGEEGGRRKANLAAYCYALMEADEDGDGNAIPPAAQWSHAARLGLPVVAATWSGGRSLHLVCRVDAEDASQYAERVAFMIGTCRANGFPVDEACKDPTRLTRAPGFMRGGEQQTLMFEDPDARSYEEWLGYLEGHAAGGAEDGEAAAGQGAGPEAGGHRRGALTIPGTIEALREAGSPLPDCLGWDTMRQGVAVTDPRGLPWAHEGAAWGERDEVHALEHVQEVTGRGNAQTVHGAIVCLADARPFNPFEQILDGIEWDREPRAAHVFARWLGAEDCDYVRAASELFLREVALRCCFEPGYKCDLTPVLKSGAEGIGKTTLCEALALEDRFYVSISSIKDARAAAENMRGKAIAELEEAAALRNVTPDVANGWLTARTDTYRAAYARQSEDRPRTANTIVTCNSTGWMDPIGQKRRFMPIACATTGARLPLRDGGAQAREELRHYVRQAYAETLAGVRRYKAKHDGLPPTMLPDGVRARWRSELGAMQATDEGQDAILGYLEEHRGERLGTLDLMVEALEMNRNDALRDKKEQERVRQIVERNAPGWKLTTKKVRYGPSGHRRVGFAWEYVGDHGNARQQ